MNIVADAADTLHGLVGIEVPGDDERGATQAIVGAAVALEVGQGDVARVVGG